MKKLVIAIAVVAVGAVGGFYFVSGDAGETVNTLKLSGNIEVTELDLSFQLPGRVIERAVSEGEPVRLGQTVARLDASELMKEVAARRAAIMAAQAALAELEAGFRPEEIAEATAAVDRARAEAERWRVELPRQRALFEKEIISSRELEASSAAYEAANARVREVDERLKLLRNGPRAERIEQARAGLQLARESLAIAETRLGYAELASPITGVVLSDNVEPGEYVAPGTPVVTVGDVAGVWLSAYINETDLGRVKLGQRVEVSTDSYPEKRYQGRITFIASQAEFTPKNVQTEKERVKLVYRIKIDIPNPDQELKPGMPADAEIQTAN
ncbi:MAG: efflux RND transporter periplasmic adaptor subunit [Acidobacteriota bacterium]